MHIHALCLHIHTHTYIPKIYYPSIQAACNAEGHLSEITQKVVPFHKPTIARWSSWSSFALSTLAPSASQEANTTLLLTYSAIATEGGVQVCSSDDLRQRLQDITCNDFLRNNLPALVPCSDRNLGQLEHCPAVSCSDIVAQSQVVHPSGYYWIKLYIPLVITGCHLRVVCVNRTDTYVAEIQLVWSFRLSPCQCSHNSCPGGSNAYDNPSARHGQPMYNWWGHSYMYLLIMSWS